MNGQTRGREVLLYLLSLFREFYPYAIAGLVVALLFLFRIPDEVLIALAVLFVLGVLIFFRYQNYRKLKQRTYESLSPEMKAEIDRERRENIARRQKFLDAMEKAGGGGHA